MSGHLCDKVNIHPGQSVVVLCCHHPSPTPTFTTVPAKWIHRDRIPKMLARCWQNPHTHPFSSFTLMAKHPEKCYRESIRPKLTDWNAVIIIYLSYITSFLQHKNRSITMITIFLNVNIQYLLHFQINLFLIYVIVIILPPLKIKTKIKSTGTDETDLCKAKTSRGRCITENLGISFCSV